MTVDPRVQAFADKLQADLDARQAAITRGAEALTPDEVAGYCRIDELERELDALRKATRRTATFKPDEDGVLMVVCPYCGSDDLQYEEDVMSVRDGFRVDASDGEPVLMISGDSDESFDDQGGNPHLWCRDCTQNSNVPAHDWE